MNKLSHFNQTGDVHMVDVGAKDITHRVAIAVGEILMQADTLALIQSGNHKKGDVLSVARIAGIMAAKQTANIIPLCHPIPLTHIDIDFELDEPQSIVRCTVKAETRDRTGIEIESLNAVQVSLLTIYDMCKSVDRSMQINNIHLQHKSGGQSGDFNAD